MKKNINIRQLLSTLFERFPEHTIKELADEAMTEIRRFGFYTTSELEAKREEVLDRLHTALD
jgi:hypothetical protein